MPNRFKKVVKGYCILHLASKFDCPRNSLTYHTNRIEGSTLTEAETSAILFHDVALPDKSLIEHLEVKNHQTALQYLLNHMFTGSGQIDEASILSLHRMLMNSIRPDAGSYRSHGVRIVGADVPAANYTGESGD